MPRKIPSAIFLITLLVHVSTSVAYSLPTVPKPNGQISSKRNDQPLVAPSMTTTSGRYVGHVSTQRWNVTEYLGIQYAQPPIGDLRFAAPVPFLSNGTFQADTQPSDCPYIAQNWGSVPGESYQTAPRIMAQESADGYNAMNEDCLKLNLWTPAQGSVKKPVMVFLYGGGFARGSINNPEYMGAHMAANQDIIVVTCSHILINTSYRIDIFGLANTPGTDSNVSLRDVRLALEWVRSNIAAFGGDASHITVFGQSQDAFLISYYAYAFPDDPIVSSFIQESGTAFSDRTQNRSAATTVWRNASANVGCNQTTDSSVLQCMRAQNVSTVLAAWASVEVAGSTTPAFRPVVDNQTVFGDYPQRTQQGKFAKKPLLLGSNDNEAGYYVLRFAGNNRITLNQSQQNDIGFGIYFCPVSRDAHAKSLALSSSSSSSSFNSSSSSSSTGKSISVYRYEYFGDWPNTRLYPGSRAYHTSEVSMIFGTMDALTGVESTTLQRQTSAYMQKAWTSFARDPENALTTELGWPRYDFEKDTLVRLGYEGNSGVSFGSPRDADAICKNVTASAN